MSVCSGLMGWRGWPSWTNWIILTCILILWVITNSAFKKPCPISCGLCVCVFTMTWIVCLKAFCSFSTLNKKGVVGGNASFWVKCVRGAFAANVFGAVLLCLQVFFVQDWKFNYSNRQRGLKEGSGLKLVFVWCLLGFERDMIVNVRVSFTNFRSIFNLFLINF